VIWALIALLSLFPLAFDIPSIWALTVVLAVVGPSIVAYGCVLAHRFDPNAGDPDPRKVLGQRHSVWGEQLVELLAAHPHAESDAPANRPRESGFFRAQRPPA
jgi:hypothetical protein